MQERRQLQAVLRGQKIIYSDRINPADTGHEIYDKIENLQSEESEILSVINLSAEWKTAAYAEKKAVAVLLIDKIYIDEDGTIEVVWII